MSYKGTVKNGVVVLPPEAKLPDGVEVEIIPVTKSEADDFTEMLVSVARNVRGLPRDLGTPKR
ncbi:MAG: hypothetical protein DME25_03765 [Verrucomicrobia bacterium]|nr:MAG: hypothetical protein DME25_03765 [Verrucomicrobiota bacterium]